MGSFNLHSERPPRRVSLGLSLPLRVAVPSPLNWVSWCPLGAVLGLEMTLKALTQSQLRGRRPVEAGQRAEVGGDSCGEEPQGGALKPALRLAGCVVGIRFSLKPSAGRQILGEGRSRDCSRLHSSQQAQGRTTGKELKASGKALWAEKEGSGFPTGLLFAALCLACPAPSHPPGLSQAACPDSSVPCSPSRGPFRARYRS